MKIQKTIIFIKNILLYITYIIIWFYYKYCIISVLNIPSNIKLHPMISCFYPITIIHIYKIIPSQKWKKKTKVYQSR